ncbi:MAG: AAA family ATPase [Acidimicrobiales bacterium]
MSSLHGIRSRESELARLLEIVEAARSGRPQLVVLSGLRRVGKTLLLQHLLQHLMDRVPDCATVHGFDPTSMLADQA